MASKRNVDMLANEDVVKIVGTDGETTETSEVKAEPTEAEVKKASLPRRSRKYTSVRAQVDKTKLYDPFVAVELVKKLSYSKFAGTITADVLVRDVGLTAAITFPHSTGKTIRVAVVDDALIEKIQSGASIDFDVLLADPAFMPKLAKLARILGPRGLMPNPKNGTLTTNTQAKQKELEAGKITLKTEKKQPVIHVVIGKTDMDTKDLVENVQALMTALTMKLVRLAISSTMSPGVKIKIA